MTATPNRGRTTRREFLSKIGGGAGAVALLPLLSSACGGEGNQGASGGESAEGAGKSIEGDLDYYSLGGYEMTKETAQWAKDNSINIRLTNIGDLTDAAPRLKSAAGEGIDVSGTNSAYMPSWSDLELFTPLTAAEIPSLDDLFPIFKDDPQFRFADGSYKVIPFNWGALGFVYLPTTVDEPTNYEVLLSPDLKGRFTFWDGGADSIIFGALALGLNPDELTTKDLKPISEFLTKVVRNAKTLVTTDAEVATLFRSDEIDAHVWGWAWYLLQDFGAEMAVPPGTRAFLDVQYIPPTVDNRPAATAFLTATTSGPIYARVLEGFAGGATTRGTVELLNDKIRSLLPYDDIEGYFGNLSLPKGLKTEGPNLTFDEAVKAWQEVKAAAS